MKPHIVCLQETFANHNTKIYIPNFTIRRIDRGSHGGGVAVLIRRDIFHRYHRQFKLNSIETCTIELTVRNKQILLTSAYAPDTAPVNVFSAEIRTLFNGDTEHFVIGDFNAKHPIWTNSTTRYGTALSNMLAANGLQLMAPTQSTYYCAASGSNSVLDFVLTNSTLNISSPEVVEEYISDHHPIVTTINEQSATSSQSRYNFKKANWPRYKFHCANETPNITNLNNPDDIDDGFQKLHDLITHARDAAVPRTHHKSHPETLSPQTIALIKEKHSVQRRYQRAAAGQHKQILKTQLSLLSSMVSKAVTLERNTNWTNYTENIKNDQAKFWRAAKTLRGGNKGIPSLKKDDDNIAIDNISKADFLAEWFESAHSLFTPENNNFDVEVDDFVNTNFPEQYNPFDIEDVTTNDITTVLKTLRPFKAAGFDGLMYILYKELPARTIEFMADLFSACFKHAHWPSELKCAKVVPIPKKEKPP